MNRTKLLAILIAAVAAFMIAMAPMPAANAATAPQDTTVQIGGDTPTDQRPMGEDILLMLGVFALSVGLIGVAAYFSPPEESDDDDKNNDL